MRDLIARSEAESVAVLLYGDSRSSWTRHRVPGSVFREWDVRWAALVCEGNSSNVGTEDGLGQVIYGLGGVDWCTAAPGGTTLGSGITNRYPASIAEQWVRPGTDHPLWISLMASVASTAGHAMHSTAAGAGGGTFRRGDPAQGRALESVEYFAVADDAPRWLGLTLAYDFDGNTAYPWHAVGEFGPAGAGTGEVRIVPRVLAGVGSSGTNIRVLMGYRVSEWHQYAGKGHNWIGTRINFAGQQGCVLGVVAQGGWSLTDHLPAVVNGVANPDWKYGSAELTEWYQKVIRSPRALIRWEVGANISQGFAFEQTRAEIRENTRVAVQRNIDALHAAGVQQVVVELVSYWGSQGDEGGPDARSTIWAEVYHELALEQGWSYYDQLGTLVHGGYTDGNCPRPPYREDSAHQSFEGMLLLGRLEWEAISGAAPGTPCDDADFDNDGDIGTDADITAFFACLAGSCCETCPPHLDFDGDGEVGTDADIESFFRVLGGLPC